jgi:RNA polymerase sporulation-specific sigma factor
VFLSVLSFAAANLIYFVLHVTNSGSFPRPLTAEEERQSLARLAAGDESARSELIEHNLRLVAHIIKKYYSNARDQDDLISIGTIGLIKAVSTFDSGKGTRLATYAARCIENEILMYFRSQKKSAQDIYISDPIDTDRDGNQLVLMDVLAADDTILDDVDLKIRSEKLHRCIARLRGREKTIIELRYGTGGGAPLTQREVASRLGISRSYVSRIEKRALSGLREMFEACETGRDCEAGRDCETGRGCEAGRDCETGRGCEAGHGCKADRVAARKTAAAKSCGRPAV